MILYFSGTGNSKYIATRIADGLNDKIESINDYLRNGTFFCDNTVEQIIFVLPTYAWRIPKVVENWIKSSDFNENTKAYFVMNCGGEIANSPKYIEPLCTQKRLIYMGCAEIRMPENYLAMFSTPTKEQGKKIIARAEPIIDNVIESIKIGKGLTSKKPSLMGKLMSSIINPLFNASINDKGFVVSDACINCGMCANICPLNNIEIKDNKPKWNGNCTHCMGCITICPKEAIEYGKKSVGRPKYRCPY